MKNPSPKVDAYIDKSADFAKPILEKIRKLFHKAHPDIEETIKWGIPCFEHKGIVGNMAAFKKHVSFGFWKAKIMDDPEGIFKDGADEKQSICSCKVETVADLPKDKVMIQYIKAAVALNDAGKQVPKSKKAMEELEIPDYFAKALKSNKKAKATFDKFPPSHKREYVEWITEAKREATREKRIATALEWMAEGKSRNWKYMR